MSQPARAALILDDAGVPALVSALLVDDPDATHILCIATSDRARRVCRHRTARLGFASFALADTVAPDAEMLLAALRRAQRHAAQRVVWPFFGADDLDAMSLAATRIRLLEDLIALETPPGALPPTIETPLLDLDEARICDLAADLDALISSETVWWCDAPGPKVCARCDGCRRWQGALAAPRSWEHIALPAPA